MTTAAAILRKFCTEIEKGPQGCIDLMAPDVSYTLIGFQQLNGKEEVRAAFEMSFQKMFKKFKWTRLDVYSTNDESVAIARNSSEVELWGGHEYRNEYLIWCRVKDGLIVEQNEFLDGGKATAAMALLQ